MIVKHKSTGKRLIAYNRDLSFVYAGPPCGFLPGEAFEGARYSEIRVIVTTHSCGSTSVEFEFLAPAEGWEECIYCDKPALRRSNFCEDHMVQLGEKGVSPSSVGDGPTGPGSAT